VFAIHFDSFMSFSFGNESSAASFVDDERNVAPETELTESLVPRSTRLMREVPDSISKRVEKVAGALSILQPLPRGNCGTDLRSRTIRESVPGNGEVRSDRTSGDLGRPLGTS
jgi:hypothetical protein